MEYTMRHRGFSACIMEAERLIGDNVFGLPPGRSLPIYQADEFVSQPETWMKGPGVFIVPVKPNKGLWFDWRGWEPSLWIASLCHRGLHPWQYACDKAQTPSL